MPEKILSSVAATLAAGALVVALTMWADLREIKNDQPVAARQLELEKQVLGLEHQQLRTGIQSNLQELDRLEERIRSLETSR